MEKCNWVNRLAGMLCILLISGTVSAKNLILNGEFDEGLDHWGSGWINTGGGANVLFSVNEDGMLSGDNCWQIQVISGTTTDYNIQRTQDLPLTAGTTYSLSFMGCYDGAGDAIPIIVCFENGETGGYFRYLSEPIELLKSVEEYGPFECTADTNDAEVDLKFFLGGNDNVLIYLDAILVDDGLPETSVDEIPDASQPAGLLLEQNYPNPFNPSTRIFYQVPSESHVRLTVFDLQGCEIATLVNEIKSKGSYETEFSGHNLPSGAYFYRLETGRQTVTKRMMLLK